MLELGPGGGDLSTLCWPPSELVAPAGEEEEVAVVVSAGAMFRLMMMELLGGRIRGEVGPPRLGNFSRMT